ncbi:MAG: hypothetical protein CVT89_07165, partial [Candidatus Altiarchaeales archaeon HGW-Altiarchaeales-2]
SAYAPGSNISYCIVIINLDNNKIVSLLDVLPNTTQYKTLVWNGSQYNVPAEYGTILDYNNSATKVIQGKAILPDWAHAANWSNISVPGNLDTGNLFDTVTIFNINVTISEDAQDDVYVNMANISYENKTETVAGKIRVPACWSKINGSIFEDLNNNGIPVEGEYGITNGRIEITNIMTNKIYETYADSAGKYEIFIPCGNYTFFLDIQSLNATLQCNNIINTTPLNATAGITDDNASYEINFGAKCRCINFSFEMFPETDYVIYGSNITYYYHISNTGCENLTQTNITGDKCQTINCPKDNLAVGESMLCNCSSLLTSDTTNTANVTAMNDYNETITRTSSAFVKVIFPSYYYDVKNTGDVNLSDIKVTDDKCAPVICLKDKLETNESLLCKCITILNQSTYNTAIVTAKAPDNIGISANASAFVKVVHPNITINVTPNLTQISYGESVTYKYEIKNTGDINLTNLNVSDNKCAPVICPKSTLAINESMVCNCTTAITQDTINNATVEALALNEYIITSSNSSYVDVVGPSVSLIAMSGKQEIEKGENVTFYYNI